MTIANEIVSKETKKRIINKTTAKISADNAAIKKLLGKGSKRLR